MKRILCFGDSNTWGYNGADDTRFPENVRWTGLLADALGKDYRVIEEGLNGRTTVFSDRIEPERCGIEHVMPILLSALPVDLIVVMLGTNDTKTHFHVNPIEIGYGLEELLLKMEFILKKSGETARFLIVAPPALKAGNTHEQFDAQSDKKASELSPIYKKIADKMGMEFMDAYAMDLPLGGDGIHLTPEGHAQLFEAIRSRILEIL